MACSFPVGFGFLLGLVKINSIPIRNPVGAVGGFRNGEQKSETEILKSVGSRDMLIFASIAIHRMLLPVRGAVTFGSD